MNRYRVYIFYKSIRGEAIMFDRQVVIFYLSARMSHNQFLNGFPTILFLVYPEQIHIYITDDHTQQIKKLLN